MTREEIELAIDTIQLILDKYEEAECLVTEITIGDEDIKALKMAIEALEIEPCEDCISRKAVLELAYDMSEIDGEHYTEPCMVVDVEDIQKLPLVNPQEPKCEEREKGECPYYAG